MEKQIGYVFYNHLRATVTIVTSWANGKALERTEVSTLTFRARSADVLTCFQAALNRYRYSRREIALGTVQHPHRFLSNYGGSQLRKAEREELQQLLNANAEKIKRLGPVKVRDYTHRFLMQIEGATWVHSKKLAEIQVDSYLPLPEFLKANPTFARLKRKRSRVSARWVSREKFKPAMKVITRAKCGR